MLNRFKRRSIAYEYSKDEINRRQEFVPQIEDHPIVKKTGKTALVSFEFEEDLNFETDSKPIPASVEYLSSKYVRETGEPLVEYKKPEEAPLDHQKFDGHSLDDFEIQQDEVDIDDEEQQDKLRSLLKEPAVAPSEFVNVPLASAERIAILEKLHMQFYSILSKIQETHTASDFKTAYDIQDRISYLLNHKTLLFEVLVDELIGYLETIVEKLAIYSQDIAKKQAKFKNFNKKISELKEYKFKTDESIKIIDENKEIAMEEFKRNSKLSKSFS